VSANTRKNILFVILSLSVVGVIWFFYVLSKDFLNASPKLNLNESLQSTNPANVGDYLIVTDDKNVRRLVIAVAADDEIQTSQEGISRIPVSLVLGDTFDLVIGDSNNRVLFQTVKSTQGIGGSTKLTDVSSLPANLNGKMLVATIPLYTKEMIALKDSESCAGYCKTLIEKARTFNTPFLNSLLPDNNTAKFFSRFSPKKEIGPAIQITLFE